MKYGSWRITTTLLALGLQLPAGSLWAQVKTVKVTETRAAAARPDIPEKYLPPVGMCRVWVDGVAPTQQPAPTDCASAVRNKPANGRVIYGEDNARVPSRKMDKLPVNKLKADEKKKGPPLVPPIVPGPDMRARDAWQQKQISDEQLYGDRPVGIPPASSYIPGSMSQSGLPVSQNGYISPGGVIIPGSGMMDPRYFNSNAAVNPPGTGSSVCLDRDGDGWCDDLRFGPPVCTDVDKDGRCDDLPEFASRAYPQVLPEMRSAQDVINGRPSLEVMQWMGTNEFIVRVPDQGQGGVPWRAIFLDSSGELLQVWTDLNRDGRADRVEIFRNGQRTKLIQR